MAQKRHRYPAMDLRSAIEGVEKIFNAEGRSIMPPKVAVAHLGYTSLNGASLKALAALKKYGLLEGRGDNLTVSADAVTILVDATVDDQSERRAALQRALTSDPLFVELADKFGEHGSPINITAYLTKKGFLSDAARKATQAFLDSMAFVTEQLGDYNYAKPISTQDAPVKPSTKQIVIEREPVRHSPGQMSFLEDDNTQQDMRNISIPIPGVPWPVLRAQVPMTEETWDALQSMLKAMKPALVQTEFKTIPEEDVASEAEEELDAEND